MTVVNPITTNAADAREHRPRPLRADALRNQKRILAAARELFAERGLDITLDDVAEHAGVGVGTVYRRFANKQELIAGVFEENVERMAEQAENAHDNPDPWTGLVDFFGYMCQHMAGNRGLGEVLVTLDDNEERFACVKERMQPAIARVIDRAKAAGELRPDGGSVKWGPGVRVRSLEQDPKFPEGATVDSVLNAAFRDLDELEARYSGACRQVPRDRARHGRFRLHRAESRHSI